MADEPLLAHQVSIKIADGEEAKFTGNLQSCKICGRPKEFLSGYRKTERLELNIVWPR